VYPDEQQVGDLKLEVGLLKKDNQQLEAITNKLSDSIEKIQEMNGNLLRMIALHEQKHESHIRTENELKDDIKDLHSRISTTTRELQDKISDTEKHLGDKIDSLRRELQSHETRDSAKTNVRAKNILNQIENYKYLILGIALTIGFIAGNANPGLIGILFK
jgi:chromosome segregation ATPase